MNLLRLPRTITLAVLATLVLSPGGARAADHVKFGVFKVVGTSSVFIAEDKGYFAAEGLDVELVPFTAQEPLVLGIASGDLDFGATAFTGGFYNLAGEGALKIIGAFIHEAPGFQANTLIASNRAYDAGLKSPKDLANHAAAVPEIGNPAQYGLSLVAEKYGVDLGTLRFMPMGSNPNVVSAIVGGQADLGVVPISFARPSLQKGDAKLIAYLGDEVPWQLGGVLAATKTANERQDLVRRFLRAYAKGVAYYYDAFIAPDGSRRDGPAAEEVIALATKYTGLPPDQVRIGIAYYDRAARLDVKDVLRQIAWYKAHGMVKGEFDPKSVIDSRYVVPLPE
ncbi:MAG TPA: ABC transporter substrate-binding protein [Stellaceae bacterium]|jgi:NitT/TauT family transport system substrate-binding protein|nr:ABC transporter substrate-binding protein [Stellaceae bacterium]